MTTKLISSILWTKLCFLRFFRRLKYAFKFRDIISWEFESCDNCGKNFKICWSAQDSIWLKIMKSESGCLCVDCFVDKANQQNFKIQPQHIERLEIFNP